MKINLIAETDDDTSEDIIQFEKSLDWELVIDGYWSEDMFHSGYIAYYVAKEGPNKWLLKSQDRNAILDDVTEEDIEEGRLNDDQMQALHRTTLEEAQNVVYETLVASAADVPEGMKSEDIGMLLYAKVCEAGGKEITE